MNPELKEKNLLNAVKGIPQEELLTLDYFKNRGEFFIERALVDDLRGAEELAFSNSIKHFHELSMRTGGGGLHSIVGNDPVALKASLTTFQWLMTSVGSSLLDTALEAAGYERIQKREEVQS